MKLKFFTLYHNNLNDFVVELKKIKNVVFVLPKHQKTPNLLGKKNIDLIDYKTKKIFNKTFMHYSYVQLFFKIKKNDTHIIVKHIFQPSNFLIYILSKLKKKQLIVYQQKIKPVNNKLLIGLIKIYLNLFLPKNTKAFSVITQGSYELRKYFNDVKYIPFAIDENKYKNRKSKYNGKTLKIISVGKLSQKRKNHILLIKALENLKKKYSNLSFEIYLVGMKNKEEKYFKELEKYCNSSILKNNINFIENMEKEELNNFYSKCDLFVLPSYDEPASYSNLEAMASKLPIIISNDNGTSCYIKNNYNGYIFKKNDLKDLLNKIDKFIDNKSINWKKINQFGEKSLELVKKNHSQKKIIDDFLKFIEK